MKISQKNLGILIGIEDGSASARMNQYERGVHTPDVRTLKLLAEELGVPLNYFFCEDEESAELACLIAKMNANDRKKLIKKLLSEQDETK